MHLAVVSHKVCWTSETSRSGYVTDGGFPLQMNALSELFSATTLIVPCAGPANGSGLSPLTGDELDVIPLSPPTGSGLVRKLKMPFWLLTNCSILWREILKADAVHAPIPGDVGTFGLLIALCLRKPLFVRHCGNWLVQQSAAEKFWKWIMERFAGGRNVMLATGGGIEVPSRRNPNIQWIFSSSLRSSQMEHVEPMSLPGDGSLRLMIACRQEEKKGTATVIDSIPLLQATFPNVTLDVVGGGSLLEKLNDRAGSLKIGDRVRFHGKVEQKSVLDLLKRSHIFCYPTSASEGFPKSVLEALASGLPVVTTRVSVLPELISTGGGILIDDPSPAAVAQAVLKITRDPGKYREMSSRAIRTAQDYTLEKWRDQIGHTLRSAWEVNELSNQKPSALKLGSSV